MSVGDGIDSGSPVTSMIVSGEHKPMKQVHFQNFGQPGATAHCVDVADVGEPASWEVVVHVEAFPIHSADVSQLTGRFQPSRRSTTLFGNEAVGRIVKVGAAVNHLRVDDRVILLANHNWSEQIKLPAMAVQRVNQGSDLYQQSMLRLAPACAYLLLSTIAKARRGDWIIQTAPLSSVGQCILRLASIFGLRTINIVRQLAARAEVQRLGGDVVVEDGPQLRMQIKTAVGPHPLRYALDAVAGPGVERLAECLDTGGQLLSYGMLSCQPCMIAPEHLSMREIGLRGFHLLRTLRRSSYDERIELYQQLDQWLADGSLKLPVDSVFPISQAHEAVQRAAQVGRRGKVLIHTQFTKASA